MTEPKHTPEPWYARVRSEFPDDVVWENGDQHAGIESSGLHLATLFQPQATAEANARRIVACVNYCAGLPTRMLEDSGPMRPASEALDARLSALERVAEAASEILAEWDRVQDRSQQERSEWYEDTAGIDLARAALSALAELEGR